MGWSCRADAGMVLDRWSKFCITSTGMSNVWIDGDTKYVFEVGNREHTDGRITGSIHRMYKDGGSDMCVKTGSFAISPDGTKVRGPACLKAFALKDGEHAPRYGIGSNGF